MQKIFKIIIICGLSIGTQVALANPIQQETTNQILATNLDLQEIAKALAFCESIENTESTAEQYQDCQRIYLAVGDLAEDSFMLTVGPLQ